ncbi:MAG: trypsin-like peptidase domain-containing protein [Planctomycetes bacterium]|nr:trypsin-like peptidase domain-containing protein [Planctomycetota bacterium]
MQGTRLSLLGIAAVGGAGLVAGVLLARCWPGPGPTYVAATGNERPAAAIPTSFADVVRQAAPGIVSVRARLQPGADATLAPGLAAGRPVYAPEPDVRNGSGFVVHARGLVVTSRHVVMSSIGIEVVVPQHGPVPAELVGEDPATDLALLRLVDAPGPLTPLPIGDSGDLHAGDWIIAVGNPFGFAQTVTAGVVSFVGRHLLHSDLGVTNDFLQFSAPVNPGSSGGPVLDLAGRVVGVTTQAAIEAQGISFAVPSATLKWALEAMERQPDGRVRRGYLGIEFASRAGTDETGAPCEGAVIVRVAAGEPADRAGLRRGDIVLRVDGERVADAQVLHANIVRRDPGTRIALALLRDGEIQDSIEAVLGEVGGPKTAERSH